MDEADSIKVKSTFQKLCQIMIPFVVIGALVFTAIFLVDVFAEMDMGIPFGVTLFMWLAPVWAALLHFLYFFVLIKETHVFNRRGLLIRHKKLGEQYIRYQDILEINYTRATLARILSQGAENISAGIMHIQYKDLVEEDDSVKTVTLNIVYKQVLRLVKDFGLNIKIIKSVHHEKQL
ncbi:MAG: hypothetical protein FWD58_03005 [Firmicutes bacterium]|nr:hypothetical protein [Bacillota bacterium]